MTRFTAILATTAGLLGCYGQPPSNADETETPDAECQLQSKAEKTPGYPFDLDRYQTEVLPALATTCATAGCHAAPAGQGGFTLWADAEPGECDYARTFNAVGDVVDLGQPGNSALLTAINGGNAAHPVSYEPGAEPLATLQTWVEDASARFLADGGSGTTPPPGASPFDYDVYQQTIQPLLDGAEDRGCALSGCHGSGAGTFTLVAAPEPGSSEMEANFLAVTERTTLSDPAASLFLRKATTRHGAAASTVLAAQDGELVLDWIRAAAEVGDGRDAACAPIDGFNVGVFRDEIFPILAGEIDLNRPGEPAARTGCTAGACHGQERGPGVFYLDPAGTPEEHLAQVTCFVDLLSTTQSEILACPLNLPGCRAYPHPGQDIFTGPEDRNYQRILSYLYSARSDRSPFDFAFFARKVNPIFSDLNAVQDGAQGRTCADASGCHGISVAGQSAPNGSNFPIFANASDPGRIAYNFASASSFADFLSPESSSLFLYPTNEIQLLTGIPHPGGEDFAVDSEEALAILEWVRGLRPDGEAFLRDWLVAGDFPATLVSDPTLVDEPGARPRIFDPSGGSLNAGQWDGLFAGDQLVDLGGVFPRAQPGGRAAYAVAYLVNTLPTSLTVQIEIDTPNAMRVFVDAQLVTQNEGGGPSNVIATLPPSGGQPVRVLLKLVERQDDGGFGFTARLRDDRGTLITDSTGEVIVTLGPNGGI